MSARIVVSLIQTELPPSALPAPVAVLTDLLGQTLARDFGDATLVLRLVPANESAVATSIGGDGVARASLPIDDAADPTPPVKAAIDGFLAMLGAATGVPNAVFVFVDASAHSPTFAARLATLDGVGSIALQIVPLAQDTFPPPPPAFAHLPQLYATLLKGRVTLDRPQAYPCGTVRLRFDPSSLPPAPAPGQIASLAPATRSTLSRWGRAVSGRRVGLALGGGGALGYAHVALIRALTDQKVPIDLIAGSSFGAVVGAYYCALGPGAYEQVIADGPRLRRAILMMPLTSATLGWQLDQIFGGLRLEELEVPLLPVATDVDGATECVLSTGTVGEGVRASGSLPGLFTPTTTASGRFVDGGMIENVPVSGASLECADLIVASNIVPPPPSVPVQRPPGGALGRMLFEFDPIGRVRDLVRSLFITFHADGVREAAFAHAEFDAPYSPVEPWELEKAAAVIANATADAIDCATTQVAPQWQQLCLGNVLPKPATSSGSNVSVVSIV